jgi:hypothetical protein
MAYSPLTWVEKSTKVGPTNMNHLELGLQAAAAVADAALPTPAGSNGQFLKKVAGVWVPTSFAASDIPSYPSDATQVLKGDGTWSKPPGYEYAYTEYTSAVTLAGTAEGTATSVVAASAVTFDGSTAVWLEFWCPYVLLNSAASWNLEFFDGSTGIGGLTGVTVVATVGFLLRRRITPSAATKTYSVKGWSSNGTSAAGAGAGGAGVNIPGYIRIVKA